jgi:hypothetical protein
MVEQFHAGAEYSVEGVSESGRHVIACITRKFTEPEHSVEIGHVLPAPLETGLAHRIEATVTAMLSALGITAGVTHTEIIVTDTQVRIIETHLRPAGDQIPYLLAEACGIDLIAALAAQSVGLPVLDAVEQAKKAAARAPTYAAIWYATPPLRGVLTSVEGVAEAAGLPGVRGAASLVGEGDVMTDVSASHARAGYAWAIGATADEALDRARLASERLRFTVGRVDRTNATDWA